MNRSIILSESQIEMLKNTYGIGFDSVGCGHVNENQETEVDASEVDLSSFTPKSELVNNIWKDNKLDSKVRLKLIDISEDFIDFLGIDDIRPTDIRLTGSICNYNWSNQSDIDVHIVYDFDKIDADTDLVQNYVDAKKNEWNEMHDTLTIYGFNVEFYVEDSNQVDVSAGEYSLDKDDWIKVPSKEAIKLHGKDLIRELSAAIMTMIDDYYDLFHYTEDIHQIEMIGDELEELRVFLKALRSEQLEKDGEMAIGNIAYKVLRRTGYLDMLYDLQNKVYDKINSID